jgi:hypothetical protein
MQGSPTEGEGTGDEILASEDAEHGGASASEGQEPSSDAGGSSADDADATKQAHALDVSSGLCTRANRGVPCTPSVRPKRCLRSQ